MEQYPYSKPLYQFGTDLVGNIAKCEGLINEGIVDAIIRIEPVRIRFQIGEIDQGFGDFKLDVIRTATEEDMLYLEFALGD